MYKKYMTLLNHRERHTIAMEEVTFEDTIAMEEETMEEIINTHEVNIRKQSG
jgi:hypothetical protein